MYSVIKIHVLPEVYLGPRNIKDGTYCDIPMGIDLLKVNNRNNRTRRKIYLKFLMFLLLTLNTFNTSL